MTSVWQVLAGLGLFLLGMDYIERGLKGLGNDLLVRVLRRSTVTPWRGVLVGAGATALMQSSTLVGLLVLAFVGAGVMPMQNALGVVAGSHVGTTLTGWLVATLGFKLDVTTLALPLIGIGGFVTALLAPQGRIAAAARLLLGFGLLLFGLGFMKTAVDGLAEQVDISLFDNYPVQMFALLGLLLATVLQSSTATMMISLSALHGGVITLPMAAAITAGAHIGTTGTMVLGVLRGDASSRRVAAFNVIYSTSTALLALFLLLPWLAPMQARLGVTDPLYMLVGFHTTFTLLGVLLFYPFIVRAAPLLERYVGARRDQLGHYISKVPPLVSEAAQTALARESLHALGRALDLVVRPFGGQAGEVLRPPQPARHRLASRPGHLEDYAALKTLEGDILDFATRMHTATLSEATVARDNRLTNAVREAVYAAKSIKDVLGNLEDMRIRPATQGWITDLGGHVLATATTLETLLVAHVAGEQEDAPGDAASGVATQTLAHLAGAHEQAIHQAMALPGGWGGYLQSTALNVIREVDQSIVSLLRAASLVLSGQESSD